MPVRPVPAATRGPIRIDLDWDALEIAVERNSPETDSYLDLATGRVITITSGDPEAVLNRQQVSENIRNYLRVELARAVSLDGEVRRLRDRRAAARTAPHLDRRQGRVPPVQGRAARLPRRARALVLVPRRAPALAHPDLARAARDQRDQRPAVGPGPGADRAARRRSA